MDKYRHEYKYLITSTQRKTVEEKIKHLMKKDEHVLNGQYNIKSIYFDDYYNRCFYENENGIDPREKYRIRIYNNSNKRILLECKRKENSKTYKESCEITREEYNKLICGLTIDYRNNIICKLNKLIKTTHMIPKVIVSYDRIPYIYKDGNVRITFDTNLSSSYNIEKFFDLDIPKRPIYPYGYELLEVKFDEFLPDLIYSTMQLESLNQTANSKYYLCRCLELGKYIKI